MKKDGFTLIELLVVVLIIGILAAIALPQYQKAVDKARASEAVQMLSKIVNAENTFFLATGTFTQNLTDLDIEVPGIDQNSPANASSQHFRYTIMNVQNNTTVPHAQIWATPIDSNGNVMQGDKYYHFDFDVQSDGQITRKCRASGGALNAGKCKSLASGSEWVKTE